MVFVKKSFCSNGVCKSTCIYTMEQNWECATFTTMERSAPSKKEVANFFTKNLKNVKQKCHVTGQCVNSDINVSKNYSLSDIKLSNYCKILVWPRPSVKGCDELSIYSVEELPVDSGHSMVKKLPWEEMMPGFCQLLIVHNSWSF